jgi:hypothetical protein
MQGYKITSPSRMNTPWFRSRKVIGLIAVACLVNWLLTGSYVAGQLEIQTTKLVLKQEECTFIQAKGLAVTQSESTGSCTAILPFRPHVSGGGGTIYMGDQRIVVADSQIIAIETLHDREWSPRQRNLMMWLGMSFALLLLVAIWMIFDIRKEQQ